MSWSAVQYTKFEEERNRPIRDLLEQIPNQSVKHAADIGCGPGNSTELLQQRFPDAKIIGMDSSADMITAARKRLPNVDFEIADVSTWNNDQTFDVIFSNAVLHWVPNHETLLPRLISKLAPGGTLAVQLPDNLDEPAHRLMRELAVDGPWAKKLGAAPLAQGKRHSVEWYYRVLGDHNTEVNIWRTVFHHPLAGGAAAVVEWFKGSGLRPFLDPLDTDQRSAYLARYQIAIADAYPPLPDGTVLLPFPRLFFVATRTAS